MYEATLLMPSFCGHQLEILITMISAEVCGMSTFMGNNYLAARLAVAGDTAVCFCPVPFLLVVWLVGTGTKFLDNGCQPSLNGSPRNLHTSLA